MINHYYKTEASSKSARATQQDLISKANKHLKNNTKQTKQPNKAQSVGAGEDSFHITVGSGNRASSESPGGQIASSRNRS